MDTLAKMITEDLPKLTTKELGKVYKYIRKMIADVPTAGEAMAECLEAMGRNKFTEQGYRQFIKELKEI